MRLGRPGLLALLIHSCVVTRTLISNLACDFCGLAYGIDVPLFCLMMAVSAALMLPLAFTSERKFVSLIC